MLKKITDIKHGETWQVVVQGQPSAGFKEKEDAQRYEKLASGNLDQQIEAYTFAKAYAIWVDESDL